MKLQTAFNHASRVVEKGYELSDEDAWRYDPNYIRRRIWVNLFIQTGDKDDAYIVDLWQPITINDEGVAKVVDTDGNVHEWQFFIERAMRMEDLES